MRFHSLSFPVVAFAFHFLPTRITLLKIFKTNNLFWLGIQKENDLRFGYRCCPVCVALAERHLGIFVPHFQRQMNAGTAQLRHIAKKIRENVTVAPLLLAITCVLPLSVSFSDIPRTCQPWAHTGTAQLWRAATIKMRNWALKSPKVMQTDSEDEVVPRVPIQIKEKMIQQCV